MKFKLLLGIALSLNLVAPIATTEVKAEPNANSNIVVAEVKTKSKTNSDLPVVDAQKWRTGKFKFPWSEVVMVDDDFNGKYIAVLDRHKLSDKFMGTSSGIISEWSNKHIKVNFYSSFSDGFTNLFTGTQLNVIPAKTISLKIGEQIFELTGENGNFPITEEIINAIKKTPDNAVKVKVIPVTEGGDGLVGASYGLSETTFAMKQLTIDAWKVVYGDTKVASE